MKRLLASTAILVAASTPLMAQTAAAPFGQAFSEGDMYGTDLIGQPLYVGETAMETGDIATAQMLGALENVGEINDLLISEEGLVKAVLLDIGGFLNVGERTIAVDMEDLRFLGDETDPEDIFVVINSTPEALENAPAFERNRLPGGAVQTGAETAETVPPIPELLPETAAETEIPEETATGAVPVIDIETAVENDVAEVSPTVNEAEEEGEAVPIIAPADDALRLTRPDVAVEGYETLEREVLTADMLTGAPVYGEAEEEIGEVSELVVDTNGQVAGAVVDVGGFLGIGERPVAISSDEMQIVQSEDGDVRVYIEASRERLEQRPVYEQ